MQLRCYRLFAPKRQIKWISELCYLKPLRKRRSFWDLELWIDPNQLVYAYYSCGRRLIAQICSTMQKASIAMQINRWSLAKSFFNGKKSESILSTNSIEISIPTPILNHNISSRSKRRVKFSSSFVLMSLNLEKNFNLVKIHRHRSGTTGQTQFTCPRIKYIFNQLIENKSTRYVIYFLKMLFAANEYRQK